MWVWDLYLCTDLEYCRRQGGRGGEKESFAGKKRKRGEGLTFWLLLYNSEEEIFVVCDGRRRGRLAR